MVRILANFNFSCATNKTFTFVTDCSKLKLSKEGEIKRQRNLMLLTSHYENFGLEKYKF